MHIITQHKMASVMLDQLKTKRSFQINTDLYLNTYLNWLDDKIYDINELEVRCERINEIKNTFEQYQHKV